MSTSPILPPYFLCSDNVFLCTPLHSEASLYQSFVNHPDVRIYLGAWFPLYETEEIEWVDGAHKKKPTDLSFVIKILEGDEIRTIGLIGLHQINWKDRHATTGTIIGEKHYWGQGWGTKAKMLLLDYAFNTLGLLNIQSRVIAFNTRSQRYNEKCGYVEIGRLPKWNFKPHPETGVGEHFDEIIMVVTRDSFLAARGKEKR